MTRRALRFVDDTEPGITRQRKGRYWQYFGPDGKRITDRDEIDRLNAIGMPPAYEKVWLCPDPNGHIQGIGYDARGRRQYRYHPDSAPSRRASNMTGSRISAGACRSCAGASSRTSGGGRPAARR